MNPFIIIVPGMILILALLFISKNNRTPKNLGVHRGKLAPLPKKPNCVSTQSDDPSKHIEPLNFKNDLKKSRDTIEEIILSHDNTKLMELTDNYIHVVYTTKGAHFKDDVEFYFDDEQKIIHMRSASRVGFSDMGVNRERYQKIKESYINFNI